MTLTHRRIYILPVKRGVGFIILVFLLLLIALIYNNNLAYLLAFLLASIFFISILHAYKNLAGIIVNPGKMEPVFAGEEAVFHVSLENPLQQNKNGLFLRSGNGTEQLLSLPASSRQTVQLMIPTFKRGRQPLDFITLYSFYPIGLFRAWSHIRVHHDILVYPKPASITQNAPVFDTTADNEGKSARMGDDYYGLREYQTGDTLRNINWKTYAKGLGLFSKEFSSGQDREIWLDFTHMPGHNLELRLSQLCKAVLNAEQGGLYYGFKLPGHVLPPASGNQHMNACLKALALFGQ